MQVYLIPTYPGLSQCTKPSLGYLGLSLVAQGVASSFPDAEPEALTQAVVGKILSIISQLVPRA